MHYGQNAPSAVDEI